VLQTAVEAVGEIDQEAIRTTCTRTRSRRSWNMSWDETGAPSRRSCWRSGRAQAEIVLPGRSPTDTIVSEAG
jgi:hypothetical protein